ncbi:hypothetical protein [Christiangramia fulva]|nr:hypothetical protein [Christiangramia fulva]
MNTINWFQNSDKKAVGDIYEGVYEIENLKGKLTLKVPNNPITLEKASLQLRKHLEGHIGNIYSTYAISNLLLKRKKVHKVDPRMKNFGSHCLIIKDVKGFTNAIFNKLDELGISYTHNIVQYRKLNGKKHQVSLFEKTHILSYQKEHRIIAWTKTNSPLKFEIGSIEKYAEIHTTEKIIETLKVDRL